MEKLSIVISVYNEEDNVIPLYNQIREAITDYHYEVVFVDDGSTDSTVNKVKSLTDERVCLIQFKKNFGQSSALLAGFDYASGDYIVTMDGDLQNDPRDIPMMVNTLKEGEYDLVTGVRINRKDDLFIRKIPSIIANRIISKASDIRIKDNGCALKVFRADLAKSLGLYGELHRLVSVLAALEGARITQVDVRHHPRIHGKSKYGLSRTIKVISDLTLLLFFKRYVQKPMHFFGSIGTLFFLAGGIISVWIILEKVLRIARRDVVDQPLFYLALLAMVVGVQLFLAGFLAEMISRNSPDRNKYIIDTRLGLDETGRE